MNFTACFFSGCLSDLAGFCQTYFSPAPPQAPGFRGFCGRCFFFGSRKTAGGEISDRLALSPHSWLTQAPREPVQHNTAIDSEKADEIWRKKNAWRNGFSRILVKKQRCKFRKVSGGVVEAIQAWKKQDWVIFQRPFTNLDTVCLKID